MSVGSPLPLLDIPHLSLDDDQTIRDASPDGDTNPPPTTTTAKTTFESLPQELIELIAFSLCAQVPLGPPTSLFPLLLVSRRFYTVLGPRNDGFYADLFKARFDWRSIERRWTTMHNIEEQREKRALLDGIIASSSEQHRENVMPMRPDDDLKLHFGSFTRPGSPSSDHQLIPVESSPWRALTNRDYAIEFRRRCTVLNRMRTAAITGVIPPNSSRPSSPRLEPLASTTTLSSGHGNATHQHQYKSTLGEPDDLTQNLWTCYLMLIENDSRNLDHLIEYACLRTYTRLFYKHSLLSEAMRPGWPRQSAGRGLGLWIGWLGGDDVATETTRENDERFFVLKPYVFGAHKFDAFHVPWTITNLPVTPKTHPITSAPTDPFFADLRPRTMAQTIVHMGRRIEMAPPVLAHAAIFSFFFRVEQDPARVDDLMNVSVGGAAASAFHMGPQPGAIMGGAGALATVKPAKTSRPILSSRIHDHDFIRLASCVDPYSSPGLPTLSCRSKISGSWEGRFSFFDFDSYRDMLGGRIRSLYEGPFGDQPQVWKIEEKVVRVKKGEKKGGKGPLLNAGFEPGQPGPRLSQSPPPASATTLPSSTTGGGSTDAGGDSIMTSTAPRQAGARRKSIDGPGDWFSEQQRTNKRPRSVQEDVFEEEENDNEGFVISDDDGDYEILLTGSGHSAWGQFRLKGRVRAYDGMFSITKEYESDSIGRESRGRWLYRGYNVGGNLVGRWRDTHTPQDLSGYEGTFLMTRRA
ncbi:hypothetical protein T439DRAFT_172170 [Meredithblackwellia eburnea MCA 4105]